jgi:hypothetical protein
LRWGETEAVVTDEKELQRLLASASKEAESTYTMAELSSEERGFLAIGLGRDESVASFVRSYSEPPWYVSKGEAAKPGTVLFVYDGHWTEFPRSYEIPTSEALAALVEFFRTGDRPRNIEWDEA